MPEKLLNMPKITVKHKPKVWLKIIALSIRDYTIIKVDQATHHQGDVRYGTTRGIECSCTSLISVSWTLFRSPGRWDKLDLDGILGKGDQLFKSHICYLL